MENRKGKQNIKVTDDTFIPCYYNEELQTVYLPAKKLERVAVTNKYFIDAGENTKDVLLSFKDALTGVFLDDIKYLKPILKYIEKKKNLHSEK